MATVIGKTSVRVDELLGDLLSGVALDPANHLVVTTRSGAITDAGYVGISASQQASIQSNIAAAETAAKTYASNQLAAEVVTIELNITASGNAAKAYADQQLATQAVTINADIAAVSGTVSGLVISVNQVSAVSAQNELDVSALSSFVTKTTSNTHHLY